MTAQAPSAFVQRPVARSAGHTPEPAHVPALLDFLNAGLRGYQALAPADWVPPDQHTPDRVERTLGELADLGTYAVGVYCSTSARPRTRKNTVCPLCTTMPNSALRQRLDGRAEAKVSTRSVCGMTHGTCRW